MFLFLPLHSFARMKRQPTPCIFYGTVLANNGASVALKPKFLLIYCMANITLRRYPNFSGFRHVVLLLFAILLTSCMVGPNFHPIKGPSTHTYTGLPNPKKTVSTPKQGKSGQAQEFLAGRDLPGEWWTLFHSPEINALIVAGLAHSPNLAAAQAALRQAKETWYAQFASTMIPNINGNASAVRQRFSEDAIGFNGSRLFDLYSVSVSVSYVLDIFGGQRRALEALCAQVDYQRYLLEAAYLTMTANIVITSITNASLRAQIAATHELIKSQENLLTIIQQQFNLGGASKANVLAQQTQLAQTRATLPPLEQSLSQNMHLLSVLIGSLPDENQLPKLNLNKLNLPTKLPISIPSRLVRQRPDIQAAEALVHAASAQIGVATANLYPQITLNGSYGFESLLIPNLFKNRNSSWSYGGALLQPLFNAGALRAKKRAAIDAYEQALAQYKQTVLQAFQNVADTLRALEHDAQLLRDQKKAEIAAHDTLNLTWKQYQLGAVNYNSLLTAQQQYQQTHIARIQAEAGRYSDTAALFQALGGGWWNRPFKLDEKIKI